MTTKTFHADLARFNAALVAADAIRTEQDGFRWIDATRVPAQLVNSYQRLMQFGYANGLV